MVLGIVRVVKADVVSEEDFTQPMMAEAEMEQGLATRHDQMRADSRYNEQRKLRLAPSQPFGYHQ